MTVLQTLIDKVDNCELIRDQIASILALECANQKALALLAAPPQDPALYDFRVYTERTDPWEVYLSDESDDFTPVVNVWYESTTFDGNASNISERQMGVGIFNIDCIGAAVALETVEGHTPADAASSLLAQRTARLVRNILMASINTYLQLQGLVWQRWPQSITILQPQMDARPTTRFTAARLVLRVKFNEFSPQYQPETLELLSSEITRSSDGRLLINADYDYT